MGYRRVRVDVDFIEDFGSKDTSLIEDLSHRYNASVVVAHLENKLWREKTIHVRKTTVENESKPEGKILPILANIIF